MADKFKVGDKVRYIICENKIYKHDIGNIFVINSPKRLILFDSGDSYFGYFLNDGTCVKEYQIEPVYDGDQASNWSLCAWKPSWIKSHG